jgi:hypothetical protein
VSKPLQAPAGLDAADALTPEPSAADRVASIMQSVLRAGSSSNEPRTSTAVAKAVLVTKKPRKVEGGEPQIHYNRLTALNRQEIDDKVSDFYNSLSELAARNGLNPADVTRYALGGELKGAKLNCWKSFQLVSGMARNGRKFIF